MAEEVNVNHFHRIFEELKNLGRMETQTLYDVINKRIINTDSYRDAMFEMNKEYPKEVVTFKDAVCVDWNMAEKVNPGVVNKIVKELQIKKIAENEEIKQCHKLTSIVNFCLRKLKFTIPIVQAQPKKNLNSYPLNQKALSGRFFHLGPNNYMDFAQNAPEALRFIILL